MRYHPSKKVIPLFYLPWIISEIVSFDPVWSYLSAWAGTFLIFYLSIFSPLRYLSGDVPVRYQIMRPIILTQLVFAGFMCSTSIFYFLDHLGFQYFTNIRFSAFQVSEHTEAIAYCQRLSLLAHASLTTGILIATKHHLPIRYIISTSLPWLATMLCISSYALAQCMAIIPALIQLRQPLQNISITCAACLLLLGLKNKQYIPAMFGTTAFTANLLSCIASGYKETFLLNLILIASLAFHYYRKAVMIIAIPLICILLYVLPTFTMIIRVQSWRHKKTIEQAQTIALETLEDERQSSVIRQNTWEFLTNRFSETGMFTTYVKQVPARHPYYGTTIPYQAIQALLPRFIWPNKPNTERLAMERVYESGVVNRTSAVSAKTRPVEDAYLTGGPIIVIIAMLVYGYLAQSICNKAEYLFGGYTSGCIIIFNSLFQHLWRGNTIEFMLNNILYSYILMIILHKTLCILQLIKPATRYEDHTHQSIL